MRRPSTRRSRRARAPSRASPRRRADLRRAPRRARRCRRSGDTTPVSGSQSKVAARRSSRDQNGFSSETAMWFGTMSRMTPKLRVVGRRRRARGTPPHRRAPRRCASGRRRRSRASSPCEPAATARDTGATRRARARRERRPRAPGETRARRSCTLNVQRNSGMPGRTEPCPSVNDLRRSPRHTAFRAIRHAGEDVSWCSTN